MRWLSDKLKGSLGKQKSVSKFLWFPRRLTNKQGELEWRWLEYSRMIYEVCAVDVGGSMEWGQIQASVGSCGMGGLMRSREETIELLVSKFRALLEGPNCIQRAIAVATVAHGRREDKGKNAYILHPLRVMFGLDTEDEMIVGVHHDDVEDTELELSDFENLGYTLSQVKIIGALSKDPEAYKRDPERAHEDYLLNIEKSRVARKIKILDMKDNARLDRLKNRVLSAKDWDRMQRYINDLYRLGAYHE